MPFSPKAWKDANREKQRVYSARYRLRQKGLDFPPEVLAQWEAEKAAKKAATKERQKQLNREWNKRNAALRYARHKERYANDPVYREQFNLRQQRYSAKKKVVLSDEDKAERARKRIEASKLANARRHQEALRRAAEMESSGYTPKTKPRAAKMTPAQKEAAKHLPKWKTKKPGRIVASCGWNGW